MQQPHPLLWTAIENTRMIRFVYHGRDRVAEPHDHGIRNGSVQLLSYQVGGFSSRPLPNWLFTKVDEMIDLEMLDQTFPGGRPTPSRTHIDWDVLFIRVKQADSSRPAPIRRLFRVKKSPIRCEKPLSATPHPPRFSA